MRQPYDCASSVFWWIRKLANRVFLQKYARCCLNSFIVYILNAVPCRSFPYITTSMVWHTFHQQTALSLSQCSFKGNFSLFSLPPILLWSEVSKEGSVQALTLQEVYICAAWCPRRSTSCEYSDLTLKDSIWKVTTYHAVCIVDDSVEAIALLMVWNLSVCLTATRTEALSVRVRY